MEGSWEEEDGREIRRWGRFGVPCSGKREGTRQGIVRRKNRECISKERTHGRNMWMHV